MRKILLLAVVALWGAVAISCDKEEDKTQTVVVASKMGVLHDGASALEIPVLLAKFGGSDSWQAIESITGFEFEEGYECRLLVRVTPYPKNTMDTWSDRRVLIKQLSKEKKESEGLPKGVD